MRAGWRWPLVVWVALSLPLVGYLGHKAPGWVSAAWTVVGIPVALVVALLVFLLGTAAGQNLRTTAFYRTVIAKTGLIWAVGLSIVLLVWCAVIERFSTGKSAPPTFADTWLLLMFAAEMVAVLAVFISLLGLAAPAKVSDIVQQVFSDSARRTVRDRLRRRVALRLVMDACDESKISFGLLGAGRDVTATRTGTVGDVDLQLPSAIAGFATTADITLTAQLGAVVGDDVPIARIDGEVGTWLDQVIQRGVEVRRRRGSPDSPTEVFSETLDLARRAVNDGVQGVVRAYFDLIAWCIEDVPNAYRMYGLDYTSEMTSEGLVPSDEQQMERDLARFCRDVLLSENREAQYWVPGIALRLATGGAREGAPLLLQQGLSLWLTQLWIGRDFGTDQLRERLSQDIPRLSGQVVSQLQSRLQGESLPLTRRLGAVPLLRRVFRFQTRVLRMYIDASDVAGFRDAWTEFVRWAQYWAPEHDVDEAEFVLSRAATDHARRAAGHVLDAARTIADAKAELSTERDWGTLNLGAWAMARYERGELDRELWEQLLGYLAGPFETLDGLVEALSAVWNIEGPIKELEEWDLDERLARSPSGTVVGTDARKDAVRWATLLLLRRTPVDAVPELALPGPDPEHFADQLRGALTAVEGDVAKWDVAVAGHLPQKVANLRGAIDQAVQEAQQAAAAELAAAPVTQNAVEDFAIKQERAFARFNRLRELLMRGGALEVRETAQAFENLGPGDLLDKRLFVGREKPFIVLDEDSYGRKLAAAQQTAGYLKLDEIAKRAPEATDPAASIVAAIDELRAEGFSPDLILVPHRIWARPFFASHPEFRWARRGSLTDEHPIELGYLADIPVMELGPEEADSIIVADVAQAIRLREQRRPGMAASLLCTVQAIDEQRARDLIVELNLSVGSRTVDEAAAQLAGSRVEAHVRVDYEFGAGDAGAAAVRAAPLPPESHDRPARRPVPDPA